MKYISKYYVPLSVLFLLQASHVSAGWNIDTSVDAGVAYNDNIYLAVAGAELSDEIFYVRPGISINGTGKRVSVQFDYDIQSVSFNENDDANEIYHNLNAITKTTLIPDLFYIDVNANHTQRSINAELTVPLDGLSVIANQEDVTLISIAPYISKQFSDGMLFELYYGYTDISYESSTTADSVSTNINAAVGTVPLSSNIDWRIVHQNNDTDSDDGLEWAYQRSALELGVNQSVQLTFLLTTGYEKNSFNNSGIEDSGSFWSAGINWRPSRRFSLRALGGERYYGDSYELDLNYRNRRWIWRVEYTENFESNSTEYTQTATGTTPPALPGDTGISTGIYLLKDLSMSVSREFAKTRFELTLYNTDREYVFDSSGSPIVENEYTRGGNITWEWMLNRRNKISLAGSSQTYRYRASTQKDKLNTATISFERNLSRNNVFDISFRSAERESNVSGFDYTQRVYSLNYTHNF